MNSLEMICFVCPARKDLLYKQKIKIKSKIQLLDLQSACLWPVLLIPIETLMKKRSIEKISSEGGKTPRKRKVLCCITWATNIDLMLNLSINVFAISAVGDLEAMARSIPFSFNAYNIPLAWG